MIERVAFKHLDRRLSARGAKCSETPVALTITPEALAFDLSSPEVGSTVQVPYAKDGAPTVTASIEAPARLARHISQPNRTEPGSIGKRFFEGCLIFIVNVEKKLICLEAVMNLLRVERPF